MFLSCLGAVKQTFLADSRPRWCSHKFSSHRLSYWINKLHSSKFNSLCAAGFEFVIYSVGIEFCPSFFFFFFFFLAVQICCIFHFAQLCFPVGLSFRPSFQLTSNLLYILWDEWIYIRARDTVWFHFSFFKWFQWKEKWVLGINTGLYSIFQVTFRKFHSGRAECVRLHIESFNQGLGNSTNHI